jgi:hypothetical protein
MWLAIEALIAGQYQEYLDYLALSYEASLETIP